MKEKRLTPPIYMDHNATTPLDPRVLRAMEPYFKEQFGNASSSSHSYGWQAQSAVKKAREQVASFVGCEPAHVIWTSGASESNNLAILGVVRAFKGQKPHLITQATEHKAILEVCEAAEEWGAEVTVLPVDSEGLVKITDLEKAIRPNTVFCSIMMSNNEVGARQPIEDIAAICASKGIIFHTDAAQGAGKFPLDLKSLPIDMLSLSGHKLYGPKGVGVLILRPRNREFELKPILFGGEQEKKLRPGTLNVPGIVGMGEACAIAAEVMSEECTRLSQFQKKILSAITERFPQVKLNGPKPSSRRMCNNLNLSFPDLVSDVMALGLSGIAYSSGSACNSANLKPSHVLKAMGLPDDLARSTVRLGFGRFTTADEVQIVTDKLLKMLEKTYSKATTGSPRPL